MDYYQIILRGESVENINMDFLADLAFLGSKLIIKIKKWPTLYVKWYPRGGSRGGTFSPNL